jgi:hypothetical protein
MAGRYKCLDREDENTVSVTFVNPHDEELEIWLSNEDAIRLLSDLKTEPMLVGTVKMDQAEELAWDIIVQASKLDRKLDAFDHESLTRFIKKFMEDKSK